MKHLHLPLAVIAMAVTGLGFATESEPVEIDGIHYVINEKGDEASVMEVDNMTSVVLPATITVDDKSIKVTSVYSSALKDCHNLKEIEFGENISLIPQIPFPALESVRILGPVKIITASTFEGCRNLREISLPGSLEIIGNEAFSGCSSLESINFPENLTRLSYGSFMGCGLKSIELPSSLEMIDSDVFTDCKALSDVRFGDGVKVIGHRAFEGCISLSMLDLPENIVSIGKDSFKDCDITYVTFGNKFYSPIVSVDASFGMTEIPFVQTPDWNYIGEGPDPYPQVLNLSGKRHLRVASPMSVSLRKKGNDLASPIWYVKDGMIVSMPADGNTADSKAFTEEVTLRFDLPADGSRTYYDYKYIYNGEELNNVPDTNGELTLSSGYIPKLGTNVFDQPINLLEVRLNDNASIQGNTVSESSMDVYSITGICVGKGLSQQEINNLPTGIYILRQGMDSKRILVR